MEMKVTVVDNDHDNSKFVQNALETAFAGKDVTVSTTFMKVAQTSSRWVAEAAQIAAVQPDVVLCDCQLHSDSSDGPNLLQHLRCKCHFTGFSYLFSGSSESIERAKNAYWPLFTGRGTGGFITSDTQRLAQQILQDFLVFGGFCIPDPAVFCINPLDRALEILNGLLPLCLDPAFPDRPTIINKAQEQIGINNEAVTYRRSFLFQTYKNYPGVEPGLRQVRKTALELGKNEIVAEVAALRDALLAVCNECATR